MIEVALAILAVGMFFVGWFINRALDAIWAAVDNLRSPIIHKEPEREELKSMLVEPLSPEEQEKVALAERIKRLNS